MGSPNGAIASVGSVGAVVDDAVPKPKRGIEDSCECVAEGVELGITDTGAHG